MSRTQDYIKRAENVILHTYNRYPVVLENIWILQQELQCLHWDMAIRNIMKH